MVGDGSVEEVMDFGTGHGDGSAFSDRSIALYYRAGGGVRAQRRELVEVGLCVCSCIESGMAEDDAESANLPH